MKPSEVEKFLARSCVRDRELSSLVLPELAPASVAWARICGRLRSGGLQQAHYGRSAAEELEPAGVGGSMLMRPGAGTEEVAHFIIASREPARRSWTLEPTHRLISTFDAALILLQVLHAFAQRRPDRTRITVVAIRGYPVRRHIGDCFGGSEERLRRGHVTVLAEHRVDQRAAAVEGAIEIANRDYCIEHRLIAPASDGKTHHVSSVHRPQSRRLRRPGRVGAENYSPAPLTEPYLRTTHTAPWINRSEPQQQLG